MENPLQFTCCVCGKPVLSNDEDSSHVLQVRKTGTTSPEMLKSHGPCLRKVIPVMVWKYRSRLGPQLAKNLDYAHRPRFRAEIAAIRLHAEAKTIKTMGPVLG
jgi:hypothetical protein